MIAQGHRPNQPFASTNRTLRREISDDILDELQNVNDLRRNADSIETSTNFHLDSRRITNQNPEYYKVDIQYRSQGGRTVAQIHLFDDANNITEVRDAFTNSLKDSHIWLVT